MTLKELRFDDSEASGLTYAVRINRVPINGLFNSGALKRYFFRSVLLASLVSCPPAHPAGRAAPTPPAVELFQRRLAGKYEVYRARSEKDGWRKGDKTIRLVVDFVPADARHGTMKFTQTETKPGKHRTVTRLSDYEILSVKGTVGTLITRLKGQMNRSRIQVTGKGSGGKHAEEIVLSQAGKFIYLRRTGKPRPNRTS